MEDEIAKVVLDHPSARVRIIADEGLRTHGLNMFYNVGKAATSKPRLVLVDYKGDRTRPNETDLALIGKGVTFDTGGLNLKPTNYIEDMYGDKGGACAVIGAL